MTIRQPFPRQLKPRCYSFLLHVSDTARGVPRAGSHTLLSQERRFSSDTPVLLCTRGTSFVDAEPSSLVQPKCHNSWKGSMLVVRGGCTSRKMHLRSVCNTARSFIIPLWISPLVSYPAVKIGALKQCIYYCMELWQGHRAVGSLN